MESVAVAPLRLLGSSVVFVNRELPLHHPFLLFLFRALESLARRLPSLPPGPPWPLGW